MEKKIEGKSVEVAYGTQVQEGLNREAPIVALESTIISHGLPYPDNLELARESEGLLREEGATPATIGVVNGVPKVGLDSEEIELLATEEIPKLSVRDLPMAVAKRCHGATTVAATAHLAALAGIRIFATGGLGGVHRGARESWDISADLDSLSHTPVAVVSSGIKSILDIPATLEYLETLSVPVVGFQTNRFPGFYLADSGYPLDWSFEDEKEAARALEALSTLGLRQSGMLIANPIPSREQLDPELHDRVLTSALEDLKRRNVEGKEVTPFLLDHFVSATEGESLRVNKQIIRNNVRLAARIATSLPSSSVKD